MSKRMIGLVASTLVFGAGIAGYVAVKTHMGEDSTLSAEAAAFASAANPNVEKMLEVDASGLSHATATIQTTRGKIRFKFYSKDAPKTVHRIVELIQKGFYNGLTFHRVVPGFVIQGGDPTGSGRGGSGKLLPAEFNARKHVAGTVAMARNPDDVNSADSQFYIALASHPSLDGHYTVFGQLIDGIEVANQIQVGDRMTSFAIEP